MRCIWININNKGLGLNGCKERIIATRINCRENDQLSWLLYIDRHIYTTSINCCSQSQQWPGLSRVRPRQLTSPSQDHRQRTDTIKLISTHIYLVLLFLFPWRKSSDLSSDPVDSLNHSMFTKSRWWLCAECHHRGWLLTPIGRWLSGWL